MLFDDLPEVTKGSSTSDLHAPQINTSKQDVLTASESCHAIENKSETKSKSLVESVGNAGTTMAFVPAALRKRKASVPVKTSVKPTRKSQLNNNDPADFDKSRCIDSKEMKSALTDGDMNENYEECSENAVTIHNVRESMVDPNAHISEQQQTEEEQEEEYKESQHLTDLHASIRSADMYHPMVPNDYLAYKQRKENELLQANLEKQAQKTYEMQRKLREQIEEERQKALASGDVKKIIESRLSTSVEISLTGGAGRGRGRGLNNLPAWLVKKQQEEQPKSSCSTMP
jgi:hypothetical protein